jgi:hypothetical protein
MKIRQWELWKAKPEGFERDHWFVVISAQERCDDAARLQINGLACFTLRGNLPKACVQLDAADGLSAPTSVACDFLYSLRKSALHSALGQISWERQQQIKSKIKELLRL